MKKTFSILIFLSLFFFSANLPACPEIISTYPPNIIRTDSLDSVRIVFDDFGIPLDTSIVLLEIDGIPHDISSPELYLIGEDTLVYSGLPYAFSPDTVEICVNYDDMNKTCDSTMVYCWDTAILEPCQEECRVLIDSLHGHPNDFSYDSFFTQYASFIRDTFGSGVYLVRVTVGEESATKRVVYLK